MKNIYHSLLSLILLHNLPTRISIRLAFAKLRRVKRFWLAWTMHGSTSFCSTSCTWILINLNISKKWTLYAIGHINGQQYIGPFAAVAQSWTTCEWTIRKLCLVNWSLFERGLSILPNSIFRGPHTYMHQIYTTGRELAIRQTLASNLELVKDCNAIELPHLVKQTIDQTRDNERTTTAW